VFRREALALGIEERPTAPGSPWQNPCARRVIGSIRRAGEVIERDRVGGLHHEYVRMAA